MSFFNHKRVCLVTLVMVCFFAFWPSLFNQFTNWDDNVLLTENPLVRNLSWENLSRIFDFYFLGYYPPLTVFSFALEHHFFGLNPFVYHLNNLILHTLNVCLVFLLISCLSKNARVAFLTALLFAISPLRVESVAWVTERKDVLFALFFLLSILAYVRNRFLVSLTFFILACMAKIQGIVLPLSLLLIDYFQKKPVNLRSLLNKTSFFMISLLFSILILRGAWPEYTAIEMFGFLDKVFLSCFALVLYVLKIVAPFDLACIYPYPEKIQGVFPWYVYASGGLILVWFWSLLRLWKTSSIFVTGSLFFGFNIILALSSIISGGYIINDRFTYVASIGLYWIAAAMIVDILATRWRSFIFAGLISYLLISVFLTYQRCKVWYDGVSLWSETIRKYPQLAFIYDNRGSFYVQKKQYALALEDFSKAIELNPRFASAYNNRAVIYDQLNKQDLALKDFNEAIRQDPSYGITYFNRCLFLFKQGHIKQAYEDALKAQDLGVSVPKNFLYQLQIAGHS